MKTSRRRLFGWLAGGVAAAALPKVGFISHFWGKSDISMKVVNDAVFMSEDMPMTFSGYTMFIPNEFFPFRVDSLYEGEPGGLDLITGPTT